MLNRNAIKFFYSEKVLNYKLYTVALKVYNKLKKQGMSFYEMENYN